MSLSSYSLASAASNGDPDYMTDYSSAEQSGEECAVSGAQQLDEEHVLEEHVYPPEYYRAQREKVNNTDVVPAYAPGTLLHVDNMDKLWTQYCEYIGECPGKLMQSLTVGDVACFFRWRLDLTRGKKGRKLRGTKDASSLGTYRKQFFLLYRKRTGKDMDKQLVGQTRKILSELALERGLSHTPREKSAMDAYDVREVAQTTITTTEKKFKVGRYRIQTNFFIQGGFITANRPDALLKLQYKHVKVTILRDMKEGGPHKILLELTYEFTKTFLGPKAPNTYPIPEILFDPSLILSPHVFLLGLMFADDVFSRPEGAPKLLPEHLSQLDIRPGCNALELPLRSEMLDTYVFRQCTSNVAGWRVSEKRLPSTTLRPHMKDLGEITGFKQVAGPYCLRYGAGNAFDRDGNMTADLRNLVMRHADSKIFLNHYLSRHITADTQAIVRGMAPQDEIMRAACRMSRWIDPDRPRHLTLEQSASVNHDPRIQKLLRQQKRYKGKRSREEKYRKLEKDIRNEKQRLKRALLVDIRKNWDRNQAERDIQQQLSGATFENKVRTKLEHGVERTPEHIRLIESLLSLPGSTLEEEYRRRSTAIKAIASYCNVEEGVTRRIQRVASAAKSKPHAEAVNPLLAALEEAKVSVYKEKRPIICFMCLGNEKKPVEERIRPLSTSGDLSRHFKRRHLAQINEDEEIKCALCDVQLANKVHLQRHARDVHGTVS